MTLRIVTPQADDAALLSLAEAKAQLRVDHDDDDDLIQSLIDGALDAIETDVQRRYFAQTLEWVCDTWPAGKPFPIAAADGAVGMTVVSISYADLDGTLQTLDPSQYWARPIGETLKIVPRWFVWWPLLGDAAERVVVRLAVADATKIRKGVKHAAKLLVSHWYAHPDAVVGVENRDSSTELPLGVDSLLWRERWEVPDYSC